jgi:hypothetical protein
VRGLDPNRLLSYVNAAVDKYLLLSGHFQRLDVQ